MDAAFLMNSGNNHTTTALLRPLVILTKSHWRRPGHQEMVSLQAMTGDDFSTTRVRSRNEPKEMTRDAAIRISMASSVMLGLRKKMTAMAPDCHTFSCAKAASCIGHGVKFEYLLSTSSYGSKQKKIYNTLEISKD